MVGGRLGKRLKAHGLTSYSSYIRLLGQDAKEYQMALDLLTTNETYFFREPQHFEFLTKHILPSYEENKPFRVWSAASSSGEEPYSIAMLLDDRLRQKPWEIVGTDISSRMLEKCRVGRYPLERTTHIPRSYLNRYCLKGVGPEQGFLLVEKELRKKVSFIYANLNGQLPSLGKFHVIFLRNVMIYFDNETKRKLVARLLSHLHAGGWLFIGHSESLHSINDGVKQVQPAIYQKP